MRFSKTSIVMSTISSALALAACGGGGSEASGPRAEGAYAGTLTGGTSTAFQLLILENDEYWALYGTSSGGSLYVAGFIQGNGDSNNGTFTSTNLKDFGRYPALAGTLNASYTAGASVSGSATVSSQTIHFSGTSIPASAYDYASNAKLADISGAWSMTTMSGASASLNITADGVFSGSSQGCSYSGTLTPRASGKNVFDLALTFGSAPCELPGQSATGIAVSNVISGTSTRQLIVAGVNSNRSAGAVIFGQR